MKEYNPRYQPDKLARILAKELLQEHHRGLLKWRRFRKSLKYVVFLRDTGKAPSFKRGKGDIVHLFAEARKTSRLTTDLGILAGRKIPIYAVIITTEWFDKLPKRRYKKEVVHHELMHIDPEKFKLLHHDVEEFEAILIEYPHWRRFLRRMIKAQRRAQKKKKKVKKHGS
jgi:putative metallopeptidase